MDDTSGTYDHCPNHPQADPITEAILPCGAVADCSYQVPEQGIYRMFFRARIPTNIFAAGTTSARFWFSFNTLVAVPRPVTVSSTATGNVIDAGLLIFLDQGSQMLNLWMMDPHVIVDNIMLVRDQGLSSRLSVPHFDVPLEASCVRQCDPPECREECGNQCVADINGEWPECGVGAGLKCCSYDDTEVLDGGHYCRPTEQTCSDFPPDPAMGETWSRPVFGRVQIGSQGRWVVFFASGYNNLYKTNVGRSLYMIDAVDGELLGRWDFSDLDESLPQNPDGIENTIPASPGIADIDDDGLVDRLYLGDLEGRLWKLDMSSGGLRSGAENLVSNWDQCLLFDAGDREPDGTREWAPIVNRPAIAVIQAGKPNVYFGTGADDRAPDDVHYRFYSIQDRDENGACGPTRYESDVENDQRNLEWIISEEQAGPGERYWADPVIENNATIFFASVYGKVEEVDPRITLDGVSRIYNVAIRAVRTASGRLVRAGESLLTGEDGNTVESLETSAKIRQAPLVVGEPQRAWARPGRPADSRPRRVMYQRFSDSDEVGHTLKTAGVQASNPMRIVRWREMPLR